MNPMTPAQAAQQTNRDGAGRYAAQIRTDPGAAALNAGCGRWSPPHITADFEDRAASADCRGTDLERLVADTDKSGLVGHIRQVFPNLTSDEADRLAVELTTCQMVAEWMEVQGGDAAWEAEAWDDEHPGQFPMMRVQPVDYVEYDPDDGHTYDWVQMAEDNAAANRQAIVTLWRHAEVRDSKLAADSLTRKPAA